MDRLSGVANNDAPFALGFQTLAFESWDLFPITLCYKFLHSQMKVVKKPMEFCQKFWSNSGESFGGDFNKLLKKSIRQNVQTVFSTCVLTIDSIVSSHLQRGYDSPVERLGKRTACLPNHDIYRALFHVQTWEVSNHYFQQFSTRTRIAWRICKRDFIFLWRFWSENWILVKKW